MAEELSNPVGFAEFLDEFDRRGRSGGDVYSGSGNFVPVLPPLRPLTARERNWVILKERRNGLRKFQERYAEDPDAVFEDRRGSAEIVWDHVQKVQSRAIQGFFGVNQKRTPGHEVAYPWQVYDIDEGTGEPADTPVTSFGLRLARTKK